jgi:hypothetical protein
MKLRQNLTLFERNSINDTLMAGCPLDGCGTKDITYENLEKHIR